jgi:serine/threonine protein kinase
VKSAPASILKVDFIVLEYLPHGSLFDVISITGCFKETDVRSYSSQLLEGLEHIHKKGLAHWDIKPTNIMFAQNLDIKITDFGMAPRDLC